MNTDTQTIIGDIAAQLSTCEECKLSTNTKGDMNLAGQRATHDLIEELLGILFPGCHGHSAVEHGSLSERLEDRLDSVTEGLRVHARRALEYQCTVEPCNDCSTCEEKATEATLRLVQSLPEIKRVLHEDIVAAYEGDPAARSTMEIVMSYPGVYAVIVHRIAHLLYAEGIPMIPRIMAEFAHSKTGIDIHPGAQIGPGFFIDHGTGVVIGETSVIGRRVKLYQGVTLGAMSFEKDEEGNLVKGVKRHPNIEDEVVIYAEATILGPVTIGKGSVIGGNVWLTHSVPAESRVYNRQPKPLIKQSNGSLPREANAEGIPADDESPFFWII